MVRWFSSRDNAVMTGRTRSYNRTMVNLDNRGPDTGRMAGITARVTGDMGWRFAGGGRTVVTGSTGSYYGRMVNLDNRLPSAG